MDNVKTTIVIDKLLFNKLNTIAQNLNISRNHLISIAMEEFIDRHKNKALIEAINMAYGDHASDDMLKFIAKPKKKKKRRWR